MKKHMNPVLCAKFTLIGVRVAFVETLIHVFILDFVIMPEHVYQKLRDLYSFTTN